MRRWLALLVALILLAVWVKESREPYLWLFADDVLHPKPAPSTLALSDGLAVRLYADARPHVGKVARLQKGLVLVVDGQERVEEGFGFGLPLVEVDGRAYLSRSAQVWLDGDTLVKRYTMDTVDTPSGFLRPKYVPVPSIGTVTVRYIVSAERIAVTVDFSGLAVPWGAAYVMNEQGAAFFTRYEEPGWAVEGERFGRWEATTSPRGCIVAAARAVCFCVETQASTRKHYGRERYIQYYWVGLYSLSWAGIDLELEGPIERLQYDISVER